MIVVDSFQESLGEGSSKGNQTKFYKSGCWVKIDNFGCSEGLAEDFVSKVEACIFDFSFVSYQSEKISYNDVLYNGCFSYNMYQNPDISFISLRKLFRDAGILLNIFIKEESLSCNIVNVVDKVGKLTGLDILGYLGRLLFLDCLIVNEDRHYMNLGVCFDGIAGRYVVAPCFDNGSSLFCVNWTYRSRKSFTENMASAKSVARPFSKFFDKQAQALLGLGVKPLVVDRDKLNYVLQTYQNPLYSVELNERIKLVLRNRLEYYKGIIYVWA